MKLRECRGGDTLGEDVSELGGGRNMEDPNISDSNQVTNKVQVDLHMLRPLMLNRVCGEVHGANVVAVDESALDERAVKLSQELSEPGCFRQPGTPPLHCSGRQPAAACTTRRQGCHRGKRHSQKYSDECPNTPPSQRWCRRRAQQRTTGEGAGRSR